MQLQLREAWKWYGSHPALQNCDLEFGPGELVAVLGLNGAGKTTLLKVLAGVTPLKSGHLLWNGHPFRREDLDRRRRLLFLPDQPFLAADRTVLENLALFLDAYEIEREADFIADRLEALDLLAAATIKTSQLSRGQFYKAGLATLFTVEPEVALLDEPFASGMDAAGISTFRTLTRDLVERESTLLYTTQLVDLALAFATRIVVLHGGLVHADLSPDELRERAAAKDDPVLTKLISDPD